MKRLILFILLALIMISCYGYIETNPEIEPEPKAIDVPVIIPRNLINEAIRTRGEIITVTISLQDPTVSQAIVNSIIRHFRDKGINVSRVSKKTLYRILSTIPRRAFRSNNRNIVSLGETFTYKLPRVIYIKMRVDDYYLVRDRIYGLENLKKALAVKWLKPYEAHVFDCSEKSAFMEYWLERNGFNTYIVMDSIHSWVMAEVEPGNWVSVESTGDCPSFMVRRKHTYRFKDIYDAIEYFRKEYDWWKEIKPGEGIIGR